MDPAWVAVVGTAVGSVGATGAAFVAAWGTRRQAALQATGQQEQWRRQLRRETYGALLSAGAEARDELGSLFTALRRRDSARDRERLVARLEETKPLVNAVRLATASVFVEGPPAILAPAKRVEEGLVLLHTAMTAVAAQPAGTGDEDVASYLAICGEQRVGVRAALTNFASAARSVLDGDGDGDQAPPAEPGPPGDSAEELSWLLAGLAHALRTTPVDLDADASLWAHGLDSLSALRLVHFLRREHGLALEGTWVFERGDRPLRQVADHLAAVRAGGGPDRS